KWGSQLAEVGACGHLATDDGFGAWPKGKDILTQIVEQRI
nr:alpha/beta hydrolase [candidate division KSB1 bacterium]NIV00164.1 alpha/beta hydrolase [Phycisphaerae bacterium]NIR72221.1 alpha/beta hydrolase [candidate division KSB1 bacterium]NIS23230.1 alpha/beta hydrolase [candidate division KSB1 bacterium]NIT70090.1 alpha/beta hydrolase [candidate division KSB1 bacterium]